MCLLVCSEVLINVVMLKPPKGYLSKYGLVVPTVTSVFWMISMGMSWEEHLLCQKRGFIAAFEGFD